MPNNRFRPKLWGWCPPPRLGNPRSPTEGAHKGRIFGRLYACVLASFLTAMNLSNLSYKTISFFLRISTCYLQNFPLMSQFCDVLLKINSKLPFCISCFRSDMIEGCGCVLQMVCLRCGREVGDEDPQVKHVNRSILGTSAFNIHTIYHTTFVLSYCQHQHRNLTLFEYLF